MRVFVCGPDGNDTMTHNVASALREMGKTVYTDPAWSSGMQWSLAARGIDDLLGKASNAFRTRFDRRAVRLAKRHRPHLTIICTATLQPETIADIRGITGGLVVCWYADAPANLKRDHVFAGEYDAVFVKDPDFVHKLRHVLGIEAHFLPEACNPLWHKPLAGRRHDGVVVAGTSYGFRNALVRLLVDAGIEVHLYGPRPSRWVDRTVSGIHRGIFLDHTNKARVFGEAVACLNSFAPAENPNSVNCRVFETCGCGGLLISEQRPAIASFFDPDSEYLPFSNRDECIDRISRAIRDRGSTDRIRAQAARRAHGQHTYRHRLEVMLDLLGLS